MYATLPLPREAVVYFHLNFEEYNYREDHPEPCLGDADFAFACERESIQALRDAFGLPIHNEGYGADGDLICKVFPNTLEDLTRIDAALSRRHIGGNDEIDAGADYMVARDFRFYPEGVNRPFYGEEPGAIGPWSEWINQHSQP